MPEGSLSTVRVAWLTLGVALGLVFLESAAPVWYALTGTPWLAGALVLWHPRLAPRATATLLGAMANPALSAAVVMVGGLFVLVAHFISVGAALAGGVWLSAGWLGLAAMREEPAAAALAVGSTTLLLLAVLLGVLEVIFRAGPLARRYGSPQEIAEWSRRYDHLWERNVLRFRTPHETIAAAPGTLRILALGDSYTWGDKIASSDSTWPALLEAVLRREVAETPVEVLNWGRNGFTTANQAELLRRLGWQADPDLVLVQFGINDALPSYPNLRSEGPNGLEPPVRLLPTRFRRNLTDDSAFFTWLERALSVVRYGTTRSRYLDLYDTAFVGWRQLVESLREIGDSAGSRGVPAWLIVYPAFVQGSWTAETHPLAPAYAQVADEAARAGFEIIDLRHAFAAEGGDWRRWRATPYDGHPGTAANVLAVRVINAALRERGTLEELRRRERRLGSQSAKSRPGGD